MMTNLVDQHVGDKMPQRLAALGPAVEEGAAVKENHAGPVRYVHNALLVHTDALVKAHEVERAINPEFAQHLIAGKVLNTHHDVAAQRTELGWQSLPGRSGEVLDVGEIRCPLRTPIRIATHDGLVAGA